MARVHPAAITGSKYTFLEFSCADGKTICHVRLVPAKRASDAAGHFWVWDGNVDRPTVRPSIHCLGCGRHFNLVAGVEQKA